MGIRAFMAMAVVVVAAAGCSSQPCSAIWNGFNILPFYLRGTPYTGQVGTGIGSVVATCRYAPLTVTGTVLDEQGNEVESTWTVDQVSSSAQFSFTPTGPGPYRFVARFEPTISVVECVLREATLFTGAKLAELPMPEGLDCLPAHLFANGMLGCGGVDVTLVADGGVVQTVSMSQVMFAPNDTMWTWDEPGTFRRWVMDGGRLSAQQHHTMGGSFGMLAVTDAELWALVDDASLYRLEVSPDAGAMLVSAPFAMTPGATLGKAVDGGGLFTVGFVDACLSSETGQVCFDAGTTFSTVTADREGIWLWNGAGVFGLYREDGQQRVAPVPSYWAHPPLFLAPRQNAALAVPTPTGFRFELFDAKYEHGWVDGDKLILHDGKRATVYQYQGSSP